jgi:glycosyltransferase involved in cell wall biosynthesis
LVITWFSNAPWAPTGYGGQTAQVIRRLRDDGHDVAVASNYGQMASVTEWEGIPVFPGGAERYSTDLVDAVHRAHLDGRPGWLITLYDVWVLADAGAGHRVASWVPVDHKPAPPKVAEWCRGHRTIAMSRYGQQALAAADVAAAYVPHGIETSVFRPRPSDFRKRHGIPEDAFLVVINAANNDKDPSRKAWPDMLLVLAAMMRRHPDVWVYAHADVTRPAGLHLPGYMVVAGVPSERVVLADPIQYRLGTYTADDLAEAYSAGDVLLATSLGEGFGLAVPEAMACGTPAIVTDATAQPELVGDTGWRVPWQHLYDAHQGAFWCLPLHPEMFAALLEAYGEKGTQAAADRSAAAIAKAQEYDADRVYAEHWRPLLRSMEAELEERPKRTGHTKAAKRRDRKAAA